MIHDLQFHMFQLHILLGFGKCCGIQYALGSWKDFLFLNVKFCFFYVHVSGYANRDLIIFTKYNIKNGNSYFLFLRALTSRISKISNFTISKVN